MDTDTQQATGFYTHRLARSYWIGGAYEFQQLNFSPGLDQATTSSFLLFNTIYLRPRMSISLFYGPQHWQYDSEVISQVVAVPVVLVVSSPVSERRWTYAAGASFNWQGERTSVQMGASRRITDGGGILGPVELVSAQAALRQRLTRSLTLAFGGIAGDNRLLANFNGVAEQIDVVEREAGLGPAPCGRPAPARSASRLASPPCSPSRRRGHAASGRALLRNSADASKIAADPVDDAGEEIAGVMHEVDVEVRILVEDELSVGCPLVVERIIGNRRKRRLQAQPDLRVWSAAADIPRGRARGCRLRGSTGTRLLSKWPPLIASRRALLAFEAQFIDVPAA